MKYRTEKDFLGKIQIPMDALWGIHTARAAANFDLSKRVVNSELIKAYGYVKLACLNTNYKLGYIDSVKYEPLKQACLDMIEARLNNHIIVDALQGGAGTSTNMNINEVLANRALQILDRQPGEYDFIDPIEDVNLHQSTNDTYPTALKVACLKLLAELENQIVSLVEAFQDKEQKFADVVKIGRTQLQDAVLMTLGKEMSAFAEAFSRDRWRIYKCAERIRVVNLGATAIGTGLGAPKKYIFDVVGELKNITGLNVARAENLIDATSNSDVFVEVSGILKALATNLLKISNDLRLLSCGPDGGIAEILLPHRQAGSSIMPAKVNPVIPEAVGQAAMLVMANDAAIANACSSGNLQLNQFMPLIADCMLNNLQLLTRACRIFTELCIVGIQPNCAKCQALVEGSTAAATALIELLGYKKATEIAIKAKGNAKTIRQIVIEEDILSSQDFDNIISAENVTKLGFIPKKKDGKNP